MELKALVLEPKLTGTYNAQNLRYQNTEAAVLSVFLVLAQHYFRSTMYMMFNGTLQHIRVLISEKNYFRMCGDFSAI